MNDMRAVIIPKSDQLNADSLLAGPITVTISGVDIRPGTEQPVSIHYEGEAGRPYKPCKSMARAMVHCWGADANNYIGRSMTLYCDPSVTWAGVAVGGIRISHMSHIPETARLMLTATKGSRKPFVIQPLKVDGPAPAKRQEQSPAADRSPFILIGADGTEVDMKTAPAWLARIDKALAAMETVAQAEGFQDRHRAIMRNLEGRNGELVADARARVLDRMNELRNPLAEE